MQKGQVDLENTTTLLSLIALSANSLAEDMMETKIAV